MKREYLLSILLLFAVVYSTAQKSVALHSNGTTTIFGGDTPLTEAYDAAVTGDTLYVSGGNFVSPTTIDKGLVIIGAGYDTDSTAVTGKTYIMSASSIVLGDNCTNLYLEGMEFPRGFLKSTEQATNITIIRCKIGTGIDFQGLSSGGAPTNSAIIQCDINGTLSLKGFTYSVISNCIIRGKITNSYNNIFKNNVILYGSYNNHPIIYFYYNTVNNNIFSTDTGPCYYNYTCQYNNFQKNVFRIASPFLGDYATDTQNYKNIDLATVYENASGGNYHLLEDAVTTYTGDDGTQVGIYGGMLPFKEGAVPINPHISFKSIQTTTDSNGFLNIAFKVEAQQN